jgi:DNA-binding NarL/FixJ family response regulator
LHPHPRAMIRVLVVDDHQIVIDGLQLLMEGLEDISCVGSAASGEKALTFLQNSEVDIVILDIEMPGMDGIACCTRIAKSYPDMHVIALTMHSERSLIKRMLEAGARGYLLKNAGRDELASAIRRVYQGKSYYSDDVAETIIRGDTTSRPRRHAMFPTLSSREKQIVQLIVDEFTTQEIADKLSISFNTVETHRRNIMDKLGAKNAAGIVRIALEHHLLE